MPLWSFKVSALHEGRFDNERLRNYLSKFDEYWYFVLLALKKTMHVSAQYILLEKCLMSFRGKSISHTFASQGLGWLWKKMTKRSRGKTWGKAGQHPLAKMVIFLSHLQHSGETLGQRKYIESSHLFFSLRRKILLS